MHTTYHGVFYIQTRIMGYITGDSMVGVIRFDRKGTCLRIASPTQTLYKHGGWPGRKMANDCTSRTLSSGAVRDGEWSEYEGIFFLFSFRLWKRQTLE